MNKKHFFGAGSALWLILFFFVQSVYAAEARPSTILATINGVAITAHELNQETALLNADMRIRNRSMTKEQVDELRVALIETMIEREVLRQKAVENRIAIQAQAVESAFSDFRTQIGGSNALQTYLSSTGQTQNQFKERLRKGLAVQRLLEREAIGSIRVSEAEMEAFYRRNPDFFESGEQIRVRHILAAVANWNDETQRTAARSKLHALKTRIHNAGDFAIMAMENSDCPSRTRGGDLGYLTREQMSRSFAEAAFALSSGDFSDVVTSRFGYHLILMLDRTPPERISFKDAREKIGRTLRRNKENAAVGRYVAALKGRAVIQRTGRIQ
jgi:peptidyl-prolyl cis-trans isomerase C